MHRLTCPVVLFSLVGCANPRLDAARPAAVAPDVAHEPAVTAPDLSPVLRPDGSDPTISVIAWFQVGSHSDPPGKEGLAYLTAQLLTEGGTKDHSYAEITDLLYPMSAGYSGHVDREMTTVHGRVHRDNLSSYLDLLTAVWTRPAFEPTDFDRIRSNAVNAVERSLRYSSDEELGKAVLYLMAFSDTPYGHPSIGTVEGLQSISLEDVKQFYEAQYTADRLVFGLAGDFDFKLVDALEATRKSLPVTGPGGSAPRVTPRVPRGKQVVLVDKPGADASISFGFPIQVRRGDPDYYALWVANSWLGEHRNSTSHLYQVIRSARGLNYGDYSYIEAFPRGGRRQTPPTNVARNHQIFEVWIRTLPNEHAHFALRAAVREVQDLVEGGMTAQEFELTRSFLRKYVLHFADNPSARLGYAIDDRFYGIEGSHLENFRRAMDKLTVQDVNEAIKKHLQFEDLHIAMITGKAKELKDVLVSDAKSSVTYTSEKLAEVLAEDERINTYKLGIPAKNVKIVPVDQVLQR